MPPAHPLHLRKYLARIAMALTAGFTGIHWSKGGRITVQPEGEANWANDIRIPLGLIDEGNGLFTLLYAAFANGGYQPVGMLKLKLVNKN